MAPRPDWILNINYIGHGISRFREAEWAYAKLSPSGAMVGYWQSMSADEVLSAVNTECGNRTFPVLAPAGARNAEHANRFEHRFDRPFEVSPFTLHHFWIDLRL